MKVTNRQSINIERCPYLGLHDDGSTSLAYASAWNYCYHATPPASILVSHQVEICLCSHYVDCIIMVSNKWGRLPRGLRGRAGVGVRNIEPSSKLIRLILFALLVVILIVFIASLLGQHTLF